MKFNTPGTIFPLVGLAVTQSWVGASSIHKRVELLREFLLSCTEEDFLGYVEQNPIYCVLGPGRVLYTLNVDFCLCILFLAHSAETDVTVENTRILDMLKSLPSCAQNEDIPFSVSGVQQSVESTSLMTSFSHANWLVSVVDDMHHLEKSRFQRKLRSRGLISYTDVGRWLTISKYDNTALEYLPAENKTSSGPTETSSGVVISGFTLDRAILPNNLFDFIVISDNVLQIPASRNCAFISLSWAVGHNHVDPGYVYPGWGHYHVRNDWAWKQLLQWKRYKTTIDPSSAVATMQAYSMEEATTAMTHWSVEEVNQQLLGKELHEDIVKLAIQFAKLRENQHVPGYTGAEAGVTRAQKSGLQLSTEEAPSIELKVCGGLVANTSVPRHHIDLYDLRPTQHCVGVAAVVEKCKKLEKVLRTTAFVGLLHHLESNPIPCVLASKSLEQEGQEGYLFFVIDHHHLLYALHLLITQTLRRLDTTSIPSQPSPTLTEPDTSYSPIPEEEGYNYSDSVFSPIETDFFSYSYVPDKRIKREPSIHDRNDEHIVEPMVVTSDSPFLNLSYSELRTLQRCCVVFTRNQTDMTNKTAFWRRMDMEGLCYLQFRGKHSGYEYLPATIAKVQDDSMRAIAWSVRKMSMDKDILKNTQEQQKCGNTQTQYLTMSLLFQYTSIKELTSTQQELLHTNPLLASLLVFVKQQESQTARRIIEQTLHSLSPGYLKLPTGFLEFQWGDYLRTIAKRKGKPHTAVYRTHDHFLKTIISSYTPNSTCIWLANLLCRTPAAWALPGHIKVCEHRVCMYNAMVTIMKETQTHELFEITPRKLQELVESWIPMDEECTEHATAMECYQTVCVDPNTLLHIWMLTYQLVATLLKLVK